MPANHEIPVDVAIVGGGVAGLSAARALKAEGWSVRVLDKGRGAGGRASTRREGELRFDHGAQYFTARDPRFRTELERWIEAGDAAAWSGRFAVCESGEISHLDAREKRFVGTPGMSSIVKHLARSVDVRFGVRVTRIDRDGASHVLHDEQGNVSARCGALILALPPEQTVQLLAAPGSSLADPVRPVHSAPCWAAMASFETRLPTDFDGLFVNDGPLSWVARDSSKPGRAPGERWILHARPAWSTEHLEESPSLVLPRLLEAFFDATGVTPHEPTLARAHRWRYARVEEPLDVGCFWDDDTRTGVCGDWCHGCRIEGAYLSGLTLADRLLRAGNTA